MKKVLFAAIAAFSLIPFISKAQWQGNTPVYFTTGSVGIGISNPSGLLHLYDNSAGDMLHLQFNAGGGGNWAINPFIYSISNGGLSFVDRKNSTTPMVISDGGNIGIGTTTPGAKLDINGSIRIPVGATNYFDIANGSCIRQDNGGSFNMNASTAGGGNGNIVLNAASGSGIYLNFSSGAKTFFGNGASGTTGVIGSDGSIGIGTTDPQGYKLAVNGNVIAEEIKLNYTLAGQTMFLSPVITCQPYSS